MTRYVIPKDSEDIEYSERVRELLAHNQTHEHIYEGVRIRKDLSHLGTKTYENSKKLNKLVRQAIDLKNHLETHMDHNNPDSIKLLRTLQKVIRLVTSYQKDIGDLPFDWVRKRFLPSKFRGWKLSYPDVESWIFLINTKPKMKYDPFLEFDIASTRILYAFGMSDFLPPNDNIYPILSDDFYQLDNDDCETVNGNKHCMEHCFGVTEDSFSNEEEEKIWLEFKEFDTGTRDSEVTNPMFEFYHGKIRSIGVDHPIVSVVGNFAVAAFNKACKKHVKKGEDDNLHGFEFMECKYLKVGKRYHFYMIIEAIEEGNPGTYMAEVTCSSISTAKLLCKFFLTDYKPFGMKAMAVSYFYCLESIRKTLDGLYKEKRAKLIELHKYTNVKERPIAYGELCRLKKLHAKLRKVLLVRCASARQRCPPDFDRMTNPDGWCDPVDHQGSGMVRRAKGTSCSGYDYYNPYIDA
ncbi:hypothetical protein CTI12_AA329770 [Artemisia annua]|uniref:Uncharacterized protein n=1 Tax=Artemisia annua TaxID=35608 RepID=A0A2U1LHS8_ARTAN|nr:hypothetical protein CTI12_AA329770 [Artemisia annua]